MANSSVKADHLAGDDGAFEAGVAVEGLVEEGGEVFTAEMVGDS